MILVDHRVGSRELLQSIRAFGVDAELTELEAADFAFTGCGDPDVCQTPLIGFERKTITDFISSMRSRRLAGFQAVRMSRLYDECYLIVEGYWRRGREGGYVEIRSSGGWKTVRGSVKYAELDRFICSLEIQGGIRVWRTADEEETAAAICDRYMWWQKPWDEHTAMQTIYAPDGAADARQRQRGHRASMVRRESTLAEKVASQLPGVDQKAVQVAAHFGSVEHMAAATEKEWQQVVGIGKVGAKRIVEAIQYHAESRA